VKTIGEDGELYVSSHLEHGALKHSFLCIRTSQRSLTTEETAPRRASRGFGIASVVGFLWIAALWHFPSAQCADLFERGLQLKGVVVPFAPEGAREPSAILRVQRVYTDYETKGFFRIGVLPMEVMEGVALEVRHPRELAGTLEDLHRWLGAKSAKRLQLRDFSLVLPASGPNTNRLEAARVRIRDNGRWELPGAVSYSFGESRISATHGSLQVTGPAAGLLTVEASPAVTTNLLLFPQP
jgi:hypothetical protein